MSWLPTGIQVLGTQGLGEGVKVIRIALANARVEEEEESSDYPPVNTWSISKPRHYFSTQDEAARAMNQIKVR